ncbi:beta-lactamase class A [Streptomyces sp. BK022]|uniref:class A beta-lactamase n=1 Tax=Streptomyces sp. BK022 TaxID=2512123 RepID=UPI00102926B9|nr:class A beta-lactamase [Streptomyces sp. BK022]RZU46250.1 beta-lactamase class A [Streptomyces sp. BK022]
MTRATPVPRRTLLRAGAALTAAAAAATPAPAFAAPNGPAVPRPELAALEKRYGARLGVYARNTRTGATVAYRADEPFAMCSTFKAIAAAAVLRDHGGRAALGEVIHYPPADILSNSEQTRAHQQTGMALGDVCAAAIQYSDNTAGNLMLRRIGGPAGLTRFFRSLGDRVSRLDRWETDLNTAVPGDPRDTTTPRALGRTFELLTLGRALGGSEREQLVGWLRGNTTSGKRFGAGLPSDWVLADKTGTGSYASANDLGVAWTGKGTPLLLSVLSTRPEPDAPVDEALIEETARLLATTLAPGE